MEKKIKIGFLFTLLLVSLNASAQFTISLKAGANLSNFTGDVDNNLFKTGFQGGLAFEYQLNEALYLQSGVMVIGKGNKYSKGTGADKETVTYTPLYGELPLHIAYKIKLGNTLKLVLHAGPYIAYGLEGKAESDKSAAKTADIFTERNFSQNKLKRLDYGIGEGIGFEFKRTTLDLSGGWSLANLSTEDSKRIKNINIYLSLMYRL